MIWRIRERSVFARLAQDGVRARAGVLWCTFLPDPSASPPRVAFAIGRAVGPAVVRNQVRRRLRVLLAAAHEPTDPTDPTDLTDLTDPGPAHPTGPDRSRSSALPPGWYLVGGRPAVAARSFPELSSDVEALIASVRAQARRLASPARPPSGQLS